jgi:hypothetical protein
MKNRKPALLLLIMARAVRVALPASSKVAETAAQLPSVAVAARRVNRRDDEIVAPFGRGASHGFEPGNPKRKF